MKEEYLIIVAGGSGSRMNNSIPKQFMEIGSVPMIIKTLKCFLDYNPKIIIIICIHPNYIKHLEELLQRFDLKNVSIQITLGGTTRFESVKNGLALLNDPAAVVAIHDAARPFVSTQTIQNCFETARKKGNAIPCVRINESIREIEGESSKAVNRDAFRIVQTPQCFLVREIKAAFEQNYNAAFTDDATVLESIGKKINLVEGNIENIKVTSPYDLQIAKSLSNNDQ